MMIDKPKREGKTNDDHAATTLVARTEHLGA